MRPSTVIPADRRESRDPLSGAAALRRRVDGLFKGNDRNYKMPPHRLPFDKLRVGTSPPQAGARNRGCDARRPFLAPTTWGRGGSGEARDGEGDLHMRSPAHKREMSGRTERCRSIRENLPVKGMIPPPNAVRGTGKNISPHSSGLSRRRMALSRISLLER